MAVEAVRAGERWTQQDDELLLDLCDRGADVEQMAAELGRTVWAVQSRLYELRQRRKDKPMCRNCSHYIPTSGYCNEWDRQVAPEQSCGRYQSSDGAGGDVVTDRVIWFENQRGRGRKTQGPFCTLPASERAAVRLSAELMEWAHGKGMDVLRCRIGALVSRREIWIKPDPDGPFKVSLTVKSQRDRTVGGKHLAARLKAAGMPAGRYYLDEARSDARTMILVYREEGRAS